MFSSSTLARVKELSNAYQNAKPFPFVVIDNFFEESFTEKLLEDFPVSVEANKANEFGEKGPKTVNRNMRDISDNYKTLCEYMVSEEFVGLVGKITGIDGLISLPNEAGGTHENRNKAVLNPHLDYNYLGERSPLHRRLNLLLYLNKDWDPAWGGNFQLHSNPREWKDNEIVSNSPDFNRCIIMETSERSWHGFDKVRVADGVSRKSISIYMFSEDRPEDQIAPRHSTFYVQPPIDGRFREKFTLARADVTELKTAMRKRDNWIHFYQREALRHSAKAETQQRHNAWQKKIMEEALELFESEEADAAAQRLRKALKRDN